MAHVGLLATDLDTKARRGRLTTAHGVIETPAFMPVGTQGSVKTAGPRELCELCELEAQIILGSTCRIFVRPELGGPIGSGEYSCVVDIPIRYP